MAAHSAGRELRAAGSRGMEYTAAAGNSNVMNAMGEAEINTSRRSFFGSLIRKTADFAVRVADVQDSARQTSWIRPPFALEELQFLSACTRCDACIEACPHGVILSLASRYGLRVAGTPVLDLQNKACHLCVEWHCVAACKPGALQLPLHEEGGVPPLPCLADVKLDNAACLAHAGQECRACDSSCPVPGALIWDQGRPYIVPRLCAGCALCREACIAEPKAIRAKAFYRRTGAVNIEPAR